MSWAFDGANSKLNATIGAALDSSWTFACWAYARTAGEGSNGLLLQTESGGVVRQRCSVNSANFELETTQSATSAWKYTAPTTRQRVAAGGWFMVVGQMDGSISNNTGVSLWQATLEQPPSKPEATVTGSGTRNTGGTAANVGNRSSQANTWDGYIEDAICDPTLWSAEQIHAFWEGWRPDRNYSGLSFWLPLIEACNSATQAPVDVGAGLTWTATSMGAGPRRPPTTTAKRISMYHRRRANAVPSRFAVAGTNLTRNGVREVTKGMNVYAVLPYVGATGGSETAMYTWFADAKNRVNFARHLSKYGFNSIRLPVTNDRGTTYLNDIKGLGDALWLEGISTLVCPFDGQAQSVGGFGDNWPEDAGASAGSLNAAKTCGSWLAYAFEYMGKPDWFLMDTYNEPNQGGSLSEADWLAGMKASIHTCRSTGYSGPVYVEGTGWSWSYPTNAASVVSYDPQVIFESHRYATPDGSSQPASDGPDATVTWKGDWPDTTAANGHAMVVGEWGVFNGGYGTGGATFDGSVNTWARAMAGAIEQAVRWGHCVGTYAWTWWWDDDVSAPANSLVTSNANDTAWETGTDIPYRNRWGVLVYGMFEDPAIRLRRQLALLRRRTATSGTTFTQTNTGSISPSGTLVKAVAKNLAGSISPTGALVKAVSKNLAGSISPTGALTSIRTKLLSMSGSISPTGALVKAASKVTTGSISPSGALQKAVARKYTGAVSPTGVVAKAVAKNLVGSISPAGALRKLVAKILGGVISPTGTLTSPQFPNIADADWHFHMVGFRWHGELDASRWQFPDGAILKTQRTFELTAPRWSFGRIRRE